MPRRPALGKGNETSPSVWPPDAQSPILEPRQRGQNVVPDLFQRLKAALADRYAIERERAGRKALPKGLKSQPNDHVEKRYDAVARVFVPYVTV